MVPTAPMNAKKTRKKRNAQKRSPFVAGCPMAKHPVVLVAVRQNGRSSVRVRATQIVVRPQLIMLTGIEVVVLLVVL